MTESKNNVRVEIPAGKRSPMLQADDLQSGTFVQTTSGFVVIVVDGYDGNDDRKHFIFLGDGSGRNTTKIQGTVLPVGSKVTIEVAS